MEKRNNNQQLKFVSCNNRPKTVFVKSHAAPSNQEANQTMPRKKKTSYQYSCFYRHPTKICQLKRKLVSNLMLI